MALSSSEHELLVQTCTNMNVAATTCREVLEMLRSLGNTGVVDIATHNNATSVHANAANLAHVVSDYDAKTLVLGTPIGNDFEAPARIRAAPTWSSLVFTLPTMGSSAQNPNNCFIDCTQYLTDTNGTKTAFGSDSSGRGLSCSAYFSGALIDADGKYVKSSVAHYACRNSAFSDGSGIQPYSSISFSVTAGTFSQMASVAEINSSAFMPKANNAVSLGYSGLAWKDVYSVNAVTVTSDRRAKKDVSALGSQAVDFIKALRPVSYRLKQGEGQLEQFNEQGEIVPNDAPDREGIRVHWGLIAQEVKEALSTAGYEDAALWCLADKDDPDSQQSLRYEELIAPMIKVIQNQQERIEALERKVA